MFDYLPLGAISLSTVPIGSGELLTVPIATASKQTVVAGTVTKQEVLDGLIIFQSGVAGSIYLTEAPIADGATLVAAPSATISQVYHLSVLLVNDGFLFLSNGGRLLITL